MKKLIQFISILVWGSLLSSSVFAAHTPTFHFKNEYQIRTSRTVGAKEKLWKNMIRQHENETCTAALEKCARQTRFQCAAIHSGLENIHSTARWTRYSTECSAQPIVRSRSADLGRY